MTESGGVLPDVDGNLGADGIVFILQSSANTELGGPVGSLGYAGIDPSVAVEFDTFLNTSVTDPSGNHVGIDTNGILLSNAALEYSRAF
jgi:hypothetical protein